MAKSKINYVCDECGHTTAKWMGNCPACGKWHTFKEFRTEGGNSSSKKKSETHTSKVSTDKIAPPRKLEDVEFNESSRIKTGIRELDRVLGGGFMNGSFVLLGGDPGVGKSTLTLQIARTRPDLSILYCAGEESAGQIKQRAKRLGVKTDKLLIYTETDVEKVIEQAREHQPDLLVVDSIQTVYRSSHQSMPGSVQQVRECAALLQRLAKQYELATLVIGHVTKDGDLAGPRVLEHMVDTVLQFEGDNNYTYRLLRTVKNRFGPAQEVGVFEMRGDGLEDILNPSQLFLADYDQQISGNAVVCPIEGSRPLLIEVQALVTPSNYGYPQRTASGYDQRRLALLLAVLEKRGGYQFSGQDVYLNVAGGFKLADTSGDLGVACSLVSSLLDRPLQNGLGFVGEVGLGAELRTVGNMEKRLSEMSKMGFEGAIVPRIRKDMQQPDGLKIHTARNLNNAIEIALK